MRTGAVVVRVEEGDALARHTPVLVLKHAQRPFGVDRTAAERLSVAPEDLPEPDQFLSVDGNDVVGADLVIFLGVPDLSHFSYPEIRRFGRRALAVTSDTAPIADEICLTLHGPGYGLDESEAFLAQVSGILEALAAGEFPPDLRVVTFLERDARRAARLRTLLRHELPRRNLSPDEHLLAGESERYAARAGATAGSERLRSAGVQSLAPDHAFVAMPFAAAFDDVFHYGIAPSVHGAGFICERIDQTAFTGDIMQRLRERIRTAAFVVADVTGSNPNVYLEVGYAWGCGVPTVLLRQSGATLEFDVRSHKCVDYSSIRELETRLGQELKALYPGRPPLS
jgi:hypothetical protein